MPTEMTIPHAALLYILPKDKVTVHVRISSYLAFDIHSSKGGGFGLFKNLSCLRCGQNGSVCLRLEKVLATILADELCAILRALKSELICQKAEGHLGLIPVANVSDVATSRTETTYALPM